MSVRELDRGRDPLVVVLACLAQPDRHVVLLSERQVRLDRLVGRLAPVFVKRVDQIPRERRTEDREFRIPLRTAEHDDVRRIDRADGLGHLLVERLETLVIFLPIELRGNGLVEQLVREHGRLGVVSLGDPLPDLRHPGLTVGTLEEPRRPRAVVDVGAGLAAGSAVHGEVERGQLREHAAAIP